MTKTLLPLIGLILCTSIASAQLETSNSLVSSSDLASYKVADLVEVERKVDSIFQIQSSIDSFPIMDIIDSFTVGDRLNGLDLDQVAQKADWSEIAKKIDWNAIYKELDWNTIIQSMCETGEGLLDNAPIPDNIADSLENGNQLSPLGNLQNCVDLSPSKMLQFLDQSCFFQLVNERPELIQEMSPSPTNPSPRDGVAEMEALCPLFDCIDMNGVFQGIDWNCFMASYDFNTILRQWKMNASMQQMSSIRTQDSKAHIDSQFQQNILFQHMNLDSVNQQFTNAFADFFDGENQVQINQNFYNKVFSEKWEMNDDNLIKNRVNLVSLGMRGLWGETREVKFIIATLQTFSDMHDQVSDLNYPEVHKKVKDIKDMVFYMLQENMIEKTFKIKIPKESAMEFLAVLDQVLARTFSEQGQYTKSLEQLFQIARMREKNIKAIESPHSPSSYFDRHFSPNGEREKLLKQYQISRNTLQLEHSNLLSGIHPKVVKDYLDKGDHQSAFTWYSLFKDLFLIESAKGNTTPSFNVPNKMAEKGFELMIIKNIYAKMLAIMEESDEIDRSNYSFYQDAPKVLTKFQLQQKMVLLYNDIGSTYFSMNNFEFAQEYLEKSWNLLQTLPNLDYVFAIIPETTNLEEDYHNKLPIHTSIVNNLTQIYLVTDQYNRAVQFLEQEASEYLHNLDRDKISSSTKKNNDIQLETEMFLIYESLGYAYACLENDKKAFSYYKLCESIAEDSQKKFHRLYSSIFLGSYYQQKAVLDTAMNYYQVAYATALELNHKDIQATLLERMGSIYQGQNKWKKAEEVYLSAEKIARDKNLYAVLHKIQTAHGKYHLKNKTPQKALSHFTNAIAIIEKEVFINSLGEDSRLIAINNSFSAYSGAILSAIQLGKIEQAFAFIQKTKSRTVNELLLEKMNTSQDIPKDLRNQLNDINSALFALESRTNNRDANWESQRRALLEKKALIRTKAREASPKFAQLINSTQPIQISTLQQKLSSSQALVEYIATDSLYALVFTHTKYEVYNLGQTHQVSKAVESFHKKISSGVRRDHLSTKYLANTSQQLNQLIWAPFAASNILDGKQEIIICPDYSLYKIPFEALWDTKDNLEVSYFQNATTFTQSLPYAPSTNTLAEKDLLIVAKSNFEEYSEENFANKPLNSQQEITQLKKVYPNSIVWQDQEADMKNLNTRNLEQFRYLYISTHGIVDNTTPSRSFLALTNRPMYTHNLFELDLDCEVSILSACQSGRGRFQRGGGIMGFTKGLMGAGSKNVITSLWSVEEGATEILFTNFFKHISTNKTPKQALALAKKDLRAFKEGKYNHPFYWAAFVLYGNG